MKISWLNSFLSFISIHSSSFHRKYCWYHKKSAKILMRPMVLKEPLRDVKKVVLPFNEQWGMDVSKGQIVGVWQEQPFCTVGRDELMLFPSTQVVNRVAEWSLTTNLFSSSEFFSYVLLPPCYCSSSRLTLLVCNLRRKSMAFGYAPSFLATKEENSQASLMNLKLKFKYENCVLFFVPDPD